MRCKNGCISQPTSYFSASRFCSTSISFSRLHSCCLCPKKRLERELAGTNDCCFSLPRGICPTRPKTKRATPVWWTARGQDWSPRALTEYFRHRNRSTSLGCSESGRFRIYIGYDIPTADRSIDWSIDRSDQSIILRDKDAAPPWHLLGFTQ